MENKLVFWLNTFIDISILDIPRSYEKGKVCYGAKFHEIKSLENFDFYFRLLMNMYYFKIEKKSNYNVSKKFMIRGLNVPSKALHVTSYSAATLPPSGFNATGPIPSSPTWSHWHFSVSHYSPDMVGTSSSGSTTRRW